MFKQLLVIALKGILKELAVNPRDIRLVAVMDGDEYGLAKIDALTISDLLNKPARARSLRIWMGKVAYTIDLGPSSKKSSRGRVISPKQRGYRD